MRKKENYNIYIDYVIDEKIIKHEKLATVKSRGLAEVTKNFYLKFYENLIQSNKNNHIETKIILM